MKKKRKAVLAVGGILLLGAASVSAYSELSVIYQAVTGKVAVHLEEYAVKDGKEVLWQDGESVLAGTQVSKIPRIFNDASDCYVRAEVGFQGEKEGALGLSVENLVGISTDWTKIGEYFYYKKLLPSGESVDLFQGIRIPEEWESGRDDENTWKASVKVDAIQAAFFRPDFTSQDPWAMEGKGYKIEKALQREPEKKEAEGETITFGFSEDMQGFTADSQEFFSRFAPFLPGGSQTGYLEFANNTEKPRQLYVKAQILDEDELLEKLELTIRMHIGEEIRVVYQGPFLASELQEYQKAGTVLAKEKGRMEFFARLPEDAGNQYSARSGKVKFLFTTDPERESPKAQSPQTGDSQSLGALWGLLIPVPVLIWGILRFLRRRRGKG